MALWTALTLAVAVTTADATWTLADARHLIDRAGFGGTPAQIARLHALGKEAAVDALLQTGPFVAFVDPAPESERPSLLDRVTATEEERKAYRRQRGIADRLLIERYRDFWMREMALSDDPVREKMALFWHGFFTSSQREVKNARSMVGQIELYRRDGLTSYASLLHAIAKDPAMLVYLNNDKNRKAHPNENFAREVLELFSMGPGHYGEQDIQEAARAFTGWVVRDGDAKYLERQHDRREKTFLGKTGNFDGDDVLDIVLAQDATARFVTAKALAFFMRPDPSAAEIDSFAKPFRASNYDMKALLRAILLSDAFYAQPAQAALFKSPVEFVASTVRRLEIQPPPLFLALAAEHLGQSLLYPPNVKGWEGGESWFNTASILNRANVVRLLVHGAAGARVPDGADGAEPMTDVAMSEPAMQDGNDGQPALGQGAKRGDAFARATRRLRRWNPDLDLDAIVGSPRTSRDAIRALSDRFLPVAPYESTVVELCRFIAPAGDDAFNVRDEETRERLQDAIHLVLSLPEYQLN